MARQWYNLRPILGHANWALFYILLGARECGKSYSVMDFLCNQYITKGTPFIWIRLTKTQAQKLLQNNAMELVDADIRARYGLNLKTRGHIVYQVFEEQYTDKNGKLKTKKLAEPKKFAEVYDLSTYYADKGSRFDKDFLNKFKSYNIAIDEFQREKNEKNTFDIAYALVNQLENLLRSTKSNTKIFFMGNTLEEASDILTMFNFIPETYGVYKLVRNRKLLMKYLDERKNAKNAAELVEIDEKYKDVKFGKRAVIHYIEPSEEYLSRRNNTIADILLPSASTFTNKVKVDNALIDKRPLTTPQYIIKFSKDENSWFTVWNNSIICEYNKEKKPVIAMTPYIDEVFTPDMQKNIIEIFDTRGFHFRNLITFKKFQKELELLKPRKG